MPKYTNDHAVRKNTTSNLLIEFPRSLLLFNEAYHQWLQAVDQLTRNEIHAGEHNHSHFTNTECSDILLQ
jgi:hypothetical protein